MEKVIRNVADIDTADRRALEHVVGQRLAEHQQVIISIVNLDLTHSEKAGAPSLQPTPPWADIYEGLSDEEVDRLDQAVRQRANFTRVFE